MSIMQDMLREERRLIVVMTFNDDSSASRPPPSSPSIPSKCVRQFMSPILLSAEMHTLPSGVAPFPGAETGTGGRIRDVQAMNAKVTADYELSNFSEGWLKVGTGAVAPPEGYAGYYELTNAMSELPIPEGVQTLFVNRLNGTEYREFDLADYPLLQFFAVLGNNTVIGVKAEGHANRRLVNLTMVRRIDRDNTVFSVKDCPQLASISLSYVSVASFAVNSSSRVLPSHVALPSLTYFYAFETVHTATTLEVKGA